MIQLEDVRKSFQTAHGAVLALADISLRIDEGEFLAIRGASGSGKSTLLSLIGGLAVPTAGRVVVASRDLAAMTSAERARYRNQLVGFVFQMFHLLPYLTVLDNVLVAATRTPASKELSDKARELLDQFGLEERLLHRPSQLSIGERQRVAMARALLNTPKLLIADEPTGNLDQENAGVLLDSLARFHRDGGTVLLATHDAEAAGRASRSLTLNKGRMATDTNGEQANGER